MRLDKILIFSLDPEQVISETQDSLTGQDQLRFKESILDGIKEVPLSMKEKLRIRRSVDGARENCSKLSFATLNKKGSFCDVVHSYDGPNK